MKDLRSSMVGESTRGAFLSLQRSWWAVGDGLPNCGDRENRNAQISRSFLWEEQNSASIVVYYVTSSVTNS